MTLATRKYYDTRISHCNGKFWSRWIRRLCIGRGCQRWLSVSTRSFFAALRESPKVPGTVGMFWHCSWGSQNCRAYVMQQRNGLTGFEEILIVVGDVEFGAACCAVSLISQQFCLIKLRYTMIYRRISECGAYPFQLLPLVQEGRAIRALIIHQFPSIIILHRILQSHSYNHLAHLHCCCCCFQNSSWSPSSDQTNCFPTCCFSTFSGQQPQPERIPK